MWEYIDQTIFQISLIADTVAIIVCPIVAHKKGRSVVGWFFGGLFLGAIGLIIICCLEPKNVIKHTNNNTNGGYNPANTDLYNKLFKKEEPKNNQWKCPNCGTINSDDNDYCTKCLDRRKN